MSNINPTSRPVQPDVDATAAATTPEGDALLGELQQTRGRGPSWMGWMDNSEGLRPLAQRLAQDGRIDAADVKRLVTEAKDYQRITAGEKQSLTRILRDLAPRFTPDAFEALSRFLGVQTGRPTTTTPTTGPTTTTPTTPTTPSTSNPGLDRANGKLPAIAGKKYEFTADGFPRVAGSQSGAPRMDAAGAETMYRAGNALVEAPAGVLRGTGVPTQEKIVNQATALFDTALAEQMRSPTRPTDAEKMRSGAAAQLLAVIEGADSPAVMNNAAKQLLDRALREPNEALRASMYRNIEPLKGSLSAENVAKIGQLKSRVLPETPPYDQWFGANNPSKTLEVRHYAHDECWEHATDPVTRYTQAGLTVTKHGTENGQEYWEMSGKMKDPTGRNPDQNVHLKLFKTHDEILRDMDDPNVHAVFYTGHSNLGGNVSEAIRRGPEQNGAKFVQFNLCRGQQNIFEVANKYPNAHYSTTRDPHYFSNMMDVSINTLKGFAARENYSAIDRRSDVESENFIRPHEENRYLYIDQDRDGKMELDPKGRDRFFDVIKREPDSGVTDLRPRTETRAPQDIDGEKVVDGVNFARTLITYHIEHGTGASAFKGMREEMGDRFFANGYFEGDAAKEPVRITEEQGADGKAVYKVAVNKAFANQGAYALGAMVQYEIFKKFAEKDGTFSADDKTRALLATGTYLSYMYCSSTESDAIMRAVGERAGVSNLTFRKVYDAIETDGHGYVTDGQANALKRSLNIR
jgi:hypothetical protein